MKRFLVAFALFPTLALAQAPPTEQQILGATIGNLFMENARLAVELQKTQAALKEALNAKQKPEPSPTDGSGSPQPEVRQEGGGPAVGRPRIQPGG